jgi:hypothetical protein
MSTLKQTIEIHADPGSLFVLSQDYAHRLAWDPFLQEARLLNGASEPGVSVRAWCVARSGLGMETEYVTFEPPCVTAVRMTRGPAFLASFSGSWRFEPNQAGGTMVTFAYHFKSRPRWLRWLLEPILHSVFKRDTIRRLRALKHAAESSNVIAAYSISHEPSNGKEPDRSSP